LDARLEESMRTGGGSSITQRNRFVSALGLCLLLAALLPLTSPSLASRPEVRETMVAHMVYFDLKDPSEAAKEKLVAACRKYLKNHAGVVFFAAGTLAEDLKRDVNIRDFHVSLHLVFKSKADHDRYQTAPAHQRFINENQAAWARVRVLDSYVR
jgi:hypothetical protein